MVDAGQSGEDSQAILTRYAIERCTNSSASSSHGTRKRSPYTYSNLDAINFLNGQDSKPVKELSASDRPHRAVLSGVYQLPFGPGANLQTV